MYKKSKQSGFTLVEILVVVSISGIVLAAAIPSVRAIFLKNSTIAYSNDFKLALYIAQNEAIKRNIRVTIKPKVNNSSLWENGWDIFEDRNENGNFDTATEEHIRSHTPSATNYTLKSTTSTFNTDISFNSMGEPVSSAGVSSSGEFNICGPDNNTSLSRTVKASFSGNITVTEGTTACP